MAFCGLLLFLNKRISTNIYGHFELFLFPSQKITLVEGLDRQGQHLEMVVGGPDLVHVEHIIPIKIKTKKAKDEFGDWPSYLGEGSETKHPHFVSRIGNLTVFAGALNIGASNNPYERKKAAYLSSAIKLTNTLPSEFPEFRFEQVENRSTDFAELAVTLWPIP